MSAIEIPSNVADKMNADHGIKSFCLDRAIQYLGQRNSMSRPETIIEYAEKFEHYLKGR